jgi:uridine phosphorylase
MNARDCKKWVVSVTRGTLPRQVYAVVPSPESAAKLAEAAKERGYKKIRVVSEDEFFERDRRPTIKTGPRPETRQVHGVPALTA